MSLCRWSFFAFRIFGPTSPEVLESFLLIPECLLQVSPPDWAGLPRQGFTRKHGNCATGGQCPDAFFR